MATSRVPARTAAVKAKPKSKVMFEAVTEPDDDGNYDALIFGEQFTLSSDVNGWLVFLASSGSLGHVVNLVDSLIVVEAKDGEDIEVARRRESERFNKLLGSQKGFKIEDVIELVNKMTEVSAGNDR